MSNSAQTLNPNQGQNKNTPAQKDQYSNQSNAGFKNESNAGKVGNNVEKDEPTAKGGMKKEGDTCSSGDKFPSKSSNA